MRKIMNNHCFAFCVISIVAIAAKKRREKKRSPINLLRSRFSTITQLIIQRKRCEREKRRNDTDRSVNELKLNWMRRHRNRHRYYFISAHILYNIVICAGMQGIAL